MDTAEFDVFGNHYRELHDKNLAITGMSSLYFARQKALMVAAEEHESGGVQVLDLGCGDGALLHFLSGMLPGAMYTGVDESAVSIKHATGAFPSIHFEVGNGLALRFPDGYFDVIILACVVHHVKKAERDQFFQEVFRVLKKNGRVYVFEHNPWNPVTRYLVRTCVFDKGVSLIKRQQLAGILLRNGFGLFRSRYYLFFPNWKSKIWAILENNLRRVPFGGQYLLIATKIRG